MVLDVLDDGAAEMKAAVGLLVLLFEKVVVEGSRRRFSIIQQLPSASLATAYVLLSRLSVRARMSPVDMALHLTLSKV